MIYTLTEKVWLYVCGSQYKHTRTHTHTYIHTRTHARIHNDGIQGVRNGSNESFTKITPSSQNRFLNSLGIRNHR